MADTQVSDACGRNTLWVQIPSLAPQALRLAIVWSVIKLFRIFVLNENRIHRFCTFFYGVNKVKVVQVTELVVGLWCKIQY